MYTDSDKALTAARASIDKLITQVQQLRAFIQDLNILHNSLMKDSVDNLEEISSLRTRLSQTDNPHIKALSKTPQRNLLSLPTDLSAASTPDDSLYQYLCSNPSADMATIAQHTNTFIRSLNLDKTGSSINPPAVTASRQTLVLTNIKRVLTQPTLRAVYDYCGLTGLQELLDNHLRCPLCTPSDANGSPTRQGRCEYQHLFLLF